MGVSVSASVRSSVTMGRVSILSLVMEVGGGGL